MNPLTLCTHTCVAEVSEEKFRNSLAIYEIYETFPLQNFIYNRGAKDTDTHKIVFKKSKKGTLPAEFEGTQFYSSEAEANKALEAKQKFILESRESKKKPPIPVKKDKFLVKVGPPKKVNNVIEQKFKEVIGSRNVPSTYTETGVEKLYTEHKLILETKQYFLLTLEVKQMLWKLYKIIEKQILSKMHHQI